MEKNIQHAIEVLNHGGIVIFPTDTAFGIGCRIDREESIKRLFTLRNRPETKAVPVLVGSQEMAKKYFRPITSEIQKLMDAYWPGALTIVYFAQTDKIPDLVRGGGKTIGLRMPDHPDLLTIINAVGVPILGPSANFAGDTTTFRMEDLDPELVKRVDFVLTGVIKGNHQASTVIDCTKQPFRVLRQGGVVVNR